LLSCILGLEIFVLNGIKQIDHDKNIPNENNKSRLGDVLTKDKISPFDSEMLLINSRVLSDIAAYLETEYKKINIEKVINSKENTIGGITLDWRNESDWMTSREKYKDLVKESVSIVLKNASVQKEGGDD